MNWLCRFLGHRWEFPGELRYEQGQAMAYEGDATEPREVSVTWVCDEVCSRCGGETWWPA